MRRFLLLPLAFLVLLLLSGCGITGNLHYHPGFASFQPPDSPDARRELGLSLGPLPLALARGLLRSNPEIAPLLQGVSGLRVYVYEIHGNGDRVHERFAAIRAELTARGWHPLLVTRDGGDLVWALVRIDGRDRVRGLAVATQDDTEVVFVNLLGKLTPEVFGAVLEQLEVSIPAITISSAQAPSLP